MAERTRSAGLRVDDALLAEVRPLQRRLGLLLDLAAVESTTVEFTTVESTKDAAEPSTMSADRLGFAVVPATA
jgi:hypothetical protein